MSKILIDQSTVELVLELLAVATFIAPKLQAKRTDVINAGLKALAEQPAPRIVDCHTTGVCVQSGLRAEQPAQQEPVAWLVVSKYSGGKRLDVEWNIDADAMAFALGRLPLYTTPQPAQRTWVGLTAKDWNVIGFTAEFRAGAEWANDKLKEKNGL